MSSPYQPKAGERCTCRPGLARDNCSACEGTGWRIDFAAIRKRHLEETHDMWNTQNTQ